MAYSQRNRMPLELNIPHKLLPLLQPYRWKIVYGGRGGAKSETIGRLLIALTMQDGGLNLCTREFQASIADSVHALLSSLIQEMGVSSAFKITDKSIECVNGGSFIFKGLRHGIDEIKSTHGIKRCWIEEAERVSKRSLEILSPTIREANSEIWASFNPENEESAAYGLVKNPPDDALVIEINWDENPFFPEVLNKERLSCLHRTPEDYEHIWGGKPRKISAAVIFSRRLSIESFITPQNARFYHGADWGFANDPTALVRFFIQDECLWIDQEAFGYGVEIDETPQLFDSIPTARQWPIKADCSRPETISYIKRAGFNIAPAAKWAGSVEDGIAHMLGFKKIIVHERCKHIAQEFRLYSYKIDKQTGDVLPVILDAWNHGIDAVRYGLDGIIQGKNRPMKINPETLRRA